MVRLNIPEMEEWIACSEAIAAKAEEACDMARNLKHLARDAYAGKATEENILFADKFTEHMISLWKYHTISSQHMKKTLETLRSCDERIGTKLDGLSYVNPMLHNRLNNSRSGGSR